MICSYGNLGIENCYYQGRVLVAPYAKCFLFVFELKEYSYLYYCITLIESACSNKGLMIWIKLIPYCRGEEVSENGIYLLCLL